MGKRFKGITYDLAQNLIRNQNIGIASLKDHSIVLICAHLYKCPEVIDSICEWITAYKYSKIRGENNCNYSEWRFIESSTMMKVLLNDFSNISDLNGILSNLEKANHLVGMQIFDFITKGAICSFIEARFFLNNLVFTSEASINLRKTVHRIMNEEASLKPFLKFKLACYYSLELETIYNCFQNLSEEKVKSLEEESVEELNDYYIDFWMRQIKYFKVWIQRYAYPTNIFISEIADPFKNDSEFLVNIFHLAVVNNNETSVQYIWKKYINIMPNKKSILVSVLETIIPFATHMNIIIYLLLEENNKELNDLFKNTTILFSLIRNLIKNIRWRDFYLKIFNKLETYFDVESCSKIFADLTNSYFTNYPTGISLDSITFYFDCLSSNSKKYIVDKTTPGIAHPFERVLAEAILKKRKELVELLLIPMNMGQLKVFFLSKRGMRIVTKAITNRSCKFVVKILRTNFQLFDFNNIKNKIFLKKGDILCKYFIKNCQFTNLRFFVDSWTKSLSFKKITNYKSRILYMLNGFLIKHILFSKSGNLGDFFSYANKVLLWFLKSKKSIKSFKRKIDLSNVGPLTRSEKRIQCYDKVRDLVLNSKYDFLAQLFIWKKTTILEKRVLRRKLLHDAHVLSRAFLMEDIRSFLNSFLQFLKDHLNLVNDVEVKNFKDIVFLKVVKMENHVIVKDLVTWCEPSRAEFKQYKHFNRSVIPSYETFYYIDNSIK